MGYTFVDDCINSNIVLLCEESDFLGVNDDEDSGQSDRIPSFPFSSSSCRSEETVRTMVEREGELLPRSDYLDRLRSCRLDLSVRREALDWIFKAHSHYSFGPMCICLGTNYLDRFLSVYDLPRDSAWSVQLLAVTCLSLAAKMDETKVPLSVDLQVGDPKFVFEAKTIQRMELLVLTTLNWRMRSFTPFSFVDHFLRKIIIDDSLLPSMSSIFRSAQLILGTIRGIDFLEFRPSEIAASVAISVTLEIEAVDIDAAISSFIHVQKERVLKCLELMKDLSLIGWCRTGSGRSFSWSLPQSPVGVLEAAISSYNNNSIVVNNVDSSNSSSSKTSVTIPAPTTMSSIASATSSHPNKKRKTDGFCGG